MTGCDSNQNESGFDLTAALGGVADSGFERAIKPRVFQFPEDHYAHPHFRNEWWYITGNVVSDSGRRFGYQVTFFRIPLTPLSDKQAADSPWATHQIWMAHVALTDIQGQQHVHDQRFARGAANVIQLRHFPLNII